MKSFLKEKIEKDIKNEIGKFLASHPALAFRYEFNDIRDLYLISYILPNNLNDTDLLWKDIADLESIFEERFGDNAPLFCEKDRLFKLSERANMIMPTIVDYATFFIGDNKDFKYSIANSDDENFFFGDLPEYSLSA